MDPKSWYTSKTLWVNVIAIGASFAAKQFGITIDGETQIAILGIVNLALRIITKQPVTFA